MFITAAYVYSPVGDFFDTSAQADGSSTFIKTEVSSFIKKVRNSDLKSASVILDLINQQVIKCRDYQLNGKIQDAFTYDELYDYFKTNYPDEIGRINQYLKIKAATADRV